MRTSTNNPPSEFAELVSEISRQVDRAIDSLHESGVHATVEGVVAYNRADSIVGWVEDFLEACQITPDQRERVNWRIIRRLGLDRLVADLDRINEDWYDLIAN